MVAIPSDVRAALKEETRVARQLAAEMLDQAEKDAEEQERQRPIEELKQAAEQGDAIAQFDLAARYEYGRGVVPDLTEAARLYGQAAEHGHAAAQVKLGLLTYRGQGRTRNPVEGYAWLLVSEANGNAEAQQAMRDLGTNMSPEELLKAQRLAVAWKPNTASDDEKRAQME